MTRSVPRKHLALPFTTALLLPDADGSDPSALGHGSSGDVAGLFLTSPLFRPDIAAATLHEAGFRWVCNMPTVSQHDDGFTGFLDDVAMGRDREEAVLDALSRRGLNILHAITQLPFPTGAADALLLVPRVDGTCLGLRDVTERGWTGPVLAIVQVEMP